LYGRCCDDAEALPVVEVSSDTLVRLTALLPRLEALSHVAISVTHAILVSRATELQHLIGRFHVGGSKRLSLYVQLEAELADAVSCCSSSLTQSPTQSVNLKNLNQAPNQPLSHSSSIRALRVLHLDLRRCPTPAHVASALRLYATLFPDVVSLRLVLASMQLAPELASPEISLALSSSWGHVRTFFVTSIDAEAPDASTSRCTEVPDTLHVVKMAQMLPEGTRLCVSLFNVEFIAMCNEFLEGLPCARVVPCVADGHWPRILF
jgi:hypothetical protein